MLGQLKFEPSLSEKLSRNILEVGTGDKFQTKIMVRESLPRRLHMKPQIRNLMEWMYPGTFYYNFENRPILSGWNTTWLCYKMKTKKDPSKPPLDARIFGGQVYSKPEHHPEMRFVDWFCNSRLHHDQDYLVIWYISWSPCPEYAGNVAEFLAKDGKVTLTIFVAQLYYFWEADYQEELHRRCQKKQSTCQHEDHEL
ncbi:DNA dC-_dU-editing enzyme APOBEC-3G-like [Gorilla gorilla gorilla]|uniref:DNA dC->dU-editing enzyme APOBEC-3G-like n=1 Tax=Gorilla gorilla gorilla TaxID=9595 RepID=UPI002445FD01|nr:DNA dC->dU-editing enzyme APOBEC-3G-like [Gorilla gorilla gorilla]